MSVRSGMMASDKPDKAAGKSTKSKTIIDVAHPDDSAPSPNSKSVIIPNRPILKDPMVVDESDKEEPEPKGPPPVKDKPAEAPKPEPKQEPEPKPKSEPEPKPAAEAADKPETEAEPDTEKEPMAEAEQEQQAKAAEQARHDAAVKKLIESKQYYLPINTVEKRRSRRFVALGILLSLVLVLAWADIALDAGLIQIDNVKPLTHFFSN